jgi:transposase
MAKKVIIANPEALTRLRAIEMLQSGKSQKEVASIFNVHQTTIGEWLRMYDEEGTERLKVPMKPRPRHELEIEQLQKLVGNVSPKYVHRINALI